MAQRRMFSLAVTDTDAFQDMPTSSQALYFHLGMHGDDDGFVGSPKKIARAAGCNDDDLRLLITKGFIIPFDTGIVVIRDWKINNTLKNDRYHETLYRDEKSLLILDETNRYRLGNSLEPPRNQLGTSLEPEHNTTQQNITQQNKDKTAKPPGGFDEFWKAYPKKKNKIDAQKAFAKVKAPLQTLLDAIERQKQSEQWKKDGGQFIPYPATWLKRGAWEDEPDRQSTAIPSETDYYEGWDNVL